MPKVATDGPTAKAREEIKNLSDAYETANKKASDAKATQKDKDAATAAKAALDNAKKAYRGMSFKSLATSRVNSALAIVKGIERLANTRNYDYTQDQAAKVVKLLRDGINSVETAFSTARNAGTTTGKQGSIFD